jgi:hypothetical protein
LNGFLRLKFKTLYQPLLSLGNPCFNPCFTPGSQTWFTNLVHNPGSQPWFTTLQLVHNPG